MNEAMIEDLERAVRTCISQVETKIDDSGQKSRRLQRVLALLWSAYDELDSITHHPVQIVRQP